MCAAALIDIDDVTSNLHTHTGERQCKSELCDAAFSLSYDFERSICTLTLVKLKCKFEVCDALYFLSI